jgi:hypothetical protein
MTANKPNPIETAIVVAQSGLELIGWLHFVESGKLHEKDWRGMSADKKIRNVLRLANRSLDSIATRLSSPHGSFLEGWTSGRRWST